MEENTESMITPTPSPSPSLVLIPIPTAPHLSVMPFITIPEPLAAIGDFTGLPAAHLVGAPVPLTEVSLGILLTGALALFRSVEAPDMVRDMALDLMRTALEAEIGESEVETVVA
jgi:hypothetical protein